MKKKITLKKQDAIDYFGSVGEIAKLLNIPSQNVSMWKDTVPEASAWALREISKQKFRRRGKLKAEINFE